MGRSATAIANLYLTTTFNLIIYYASHPPSIQLGRYHSFPYATNSSSKQPNIQLIQRHSCTLPSHSYSFSPRIVPYLLSLFSHYIHHTPHVGADSHFFKQKAYVQYTLMALPSDISLIPLSPLQL